MFLLVSVDCPVALIKIKYTIKANCCMVACGQQFVKIPNRPGTAVFCFVLMDTNGLIDFNLLSLGLFQTGSYKNLCDNNLPYTECQLTISC